MACAGRSSLLARPASIIAEDGTHAVVAVRVPKSWLQGNLHFLAALADIAGGGTPASISAQSPKNADLE